MLFSYSLGAGHPHDKGLLALAVMESLKPEARNAREYFESALEQIGCVQCVADVIIDRKGNGSVAVDLLECDLPFVVAFLPFMVTMGYRAAPFSKPSFAAFSIALPN